MSFGDDTNGAADVFVYGPQRAPHTERISKRVRRRGQRRTASAATPRLWRRSWSFRERTANQYTSPATHYGFSDVFVRDWLSGDLRQINGTGWPGDVYGITDHHEHARSPALWRSYLPASSPTLSPPLLPPPSPPPPPFPIGAATVADRHRRSRRAARSPRRGPARWLLAPGRRAPDRASAPREPALIALTRSVRPRGLRRDVVRPGPRDRRRGRRKGVSFTDGAGECSWAT
jgi:hypothetical protein